MRPLSGQPLHRILVRATNWVGDAVMSLPALRAVRARFPEAEIAVLARPWVADIYARESFANRVIPYTPASGAGDWAAKWALARSLKGDGFDLALLMPNSFESAALMFAAGIPRRAGYSRDARGLLLTHGVSVPLKGSIPRHESYYYLELVRRLGLIQDLPQDVVIRLERVGEAATAGTDLLSRFGITPPVIGLSPGAAYGGAKRWLPERFAEAAVRVASEVGASVAVFGTSQEADVCGKVAADIAARGIGARSFASQTSLRQFIEMAAACRAFLTNDSGSMHIASALGIPTVTVFGATDHIATGPTGDRARIVREPVDCSPCLLRECPIDHRCMTRVTTDQVALTTLELLK